MGRRVILLLLLFLFVFLFLFFFFFLLDSRGGDSGDEGHGLLVEEQKRQQVHALESEIEFNEAMIAEREEGIKDIESSIAQVNEIFKDLSLMVKEQGQTLDTIEGNISSVVTHTDGANDELKGATKYQVREDFFFFLSLLFFLSLTFSSYLPEKIKKQDVLPACDWRGSPDRLGADYCLHCSVIRLWEISTVFLSFSFPFLLSYCECHLQHCYHFPSP